MEKFRECSSFWQRSLLACTLATRECNSWRTKFRLKITCLFPCVLEGGWFVRWYKMKQFTRHTFRTKCNTNFHNYFWRSAETTVIESPIAYIHTPHTFCVKYGGLMTCNFSLFIAFSCFSCERTDSTGIGFCRKEENNTFALPDYSCHIFMLHFPGSPLFNFKTVDFLNFLAHFYI